jgi:hypothetical protein
MHISEQIADGLGVALNEASLAGVEYEAERNLACATLICLALPQDGPEPEDARRVFIFKQIGRIAASLRTGTDSNEVVERFEAHDLLSTVQSFDGQPIYGWKFINAHDAFLAQWGNRLSLDLRPRSGSMKNSFTLFQQTYGRCFNLCIWFESFEIFDAMGNPISIADFIAGGERWWSAMQAGDPRTQGHGIVPADRSFTLVAERGDQFEIHGKSWIPTLKLIRARGLVDEQTYQLMSVPGRCAHIDHTSATRISEEMSSLLGEMKLGDRLLDDLTIQPQTQSEAEFPDLGRSASYEWLMTFKDFCTNSGGFTVV